MMFWTKSLKPSSTNAPKFKFFCWNMYDVHTMLSWEEFMIECHRLKALYNSKLLLHNKSCYKRAPLNNNQILLLVISELVGQLCWSSLIPFMHLQSSVSHRGAGLFRMASSWMTWFLSTFFCISPAG